MASSKAPVNKPVDAEALLALMGGSVPPPQKNANTILPPTPVVESMEDELVSVVENAEKQEPPVKRKKDSYDEVFLRPVVITLRKPMTVSVGTHERVERVIRMVFDNKITLSSFVENILLHHLEKYEVDFKRRLAEKKFEL